MDFSAKHPLGEGPRKSADGAKEGPAATPLPPPKQPAHLRPSCTCFFPACAAETKWTLWFDNPNGKQKQTTWGQTLRAVYTFDTVEDFWWCARAASGSNRAVAAAVPPCRLLHAGIVFPLLHLPLFAPA